MKDDLFTPVHPTTALHPQFASVMSSPLFGPARGMFRELAAEMEDPDGNFIEQFQTYGFDSRTFELYLFALFREAGFAIDRRHERPDFLLVKGEHTIAVEAVTANPPPTKVIQPYRVQPADRRGADLQAYLSHEVPIRLGSPLYTKLKKLYWDLDHVRGKPLVLAIQDFHAAGSLTTTAIPLASYLLGLSPAWHYEQDGNLVITHRPIDEHRVGEKVIPSGFFGLHGAEHISGVLFSNAGTASKFNRIGHEGKHRSNAVHLIRYGTCYRHDANSHLPDGFVYEVGTREDRESWREGSVFIHNPRALYPLPIGLLGASADNVLIDGQVASTFQEPFHPFGSLTLVFPGHASASWLRAQMGQVDAELARLLAAYR